MDVLQTPSGTLELTRRPNEQQLRAFDAADSLLLAYLADVDLSGTVVVLGDRWGALSTALAASSPISVSDSSVAQSSTRDNLARNGLAVELRAVTDALPERVDVLVFRVPRTVSLLEHTLHLLAPRLHAGSVVVGAGMVKEVHTSALRTCEQVLGRTRTSLATRKARLIHVEPDPDLVRPPNPWPRELLLPADAPAGLAGVTVVQQAGVFSAEHLDVGTRFLLEHLPRSEGRVVDLGCGNGVLGVAAGLASKDAQVVLTDESYLAVASASATWRAVHGGRPVEAVVGEGMDAVDGPVDLVLCNPPFHTGHGTSDATAWAMFTGARRALAPGGELWVVGNRHLGHHARLKRLFGGVSVVASNPKFVVLRAVAR
ncbi:MAG: methyltransferase [Mycobacteriaceae bacterium]